MGLVKCPRCELNYMKEGEKYCKVCAREMRGLDDTHEHLELCVVCGVRPAQLGSELCVECLREHKMMEDLNEDPYVDLADPAEEALHEVDDLDDMELDLGEDDDAPAEEIDEIEREFDSEEDE